MFNADRPPLEELPTARQLRRSTFIAAVSAAVILVAVVLPAEYGIDPTGAGRVLGLTEMGEIKQELADEAARDALNHASDQSFLDRVLNALVPAAHAQEVWSDEVTFTLPPGAYTEVKLVMPEGATAEYAWTASGGRINFDLHAHGKGQSIDYEKGRGQTSGEGSFQTPFAGQHGWFWRNRDRADVTITLQLRGGYSEIVQGQ